MGKKLNENTTLSFWKNNPIAFLNLLTLHNVKETWAKATKNKKLNLVVKV